MNNLYKKLNISIDPNLLEKLIGINTLDYTVFFEYDIKDIKALDEFINSTVKFNIKPDVTNITRITNPGVIPHVDAWQTALNFYLSGTEDSNVTKFWKLKNREIPIGKTSISYDPSVDQLEYIGELTIAKGDCYLLNTRMVHSVNVDYDDRYILRFCWYEKTLDEITNSIEILS